MSDLLTAQEYKAVAAGLTFPTQAFIDGGFRAAVSGKTFDTINPATGDVIAQVAACASADVDVAVEKARNRIGEKENCDRYQDARHDTEDERRA